MSGSDEESDHRPKDRKRNNRSSSRERNQSKKSPRGEKNEGNDDIIDSDGTKKDRANGNKNHPDSEKEERDLDPEEKEKRDREERIAASLRKREEEVAKELSGHLHARDKEREQHRRSEAISAFQALLTDLIKHPDFTWKEGKKIFKKDSR